MNNMVSETPDPFPPLNLPLPAEKEPEAEAVVREPWLMSVFIFSYSLIFLLGMTGNCLVAFVVVRNKAMQVSCRMSCYVVMS